jgi:hypothetical protein
MTAAAAPQSVSQTLRNPLSLIVAAGFAGGAVDFLYASLMALARGRPATLPWRIVASGWIGWDARAGAGPVVLGVVTHFGIAICMAAAYILVVRRAPVVARRPWATAPLYGLVLYGIMYLVVVPLRFGAPWQWQTPLSIFDIAAHIGVALAIVAVSARPRLP